MSWTSRLGACRRRRARTTPRVSSRAAPERVATGSRARTPGRPPSPCRVRASTTGCRSRALPLRSASRRVPDPSADLSTDRRPPRSSPRPIRAHATARKRVVLASRPHVGNDVNIERRTDRRRGGLRHQPEDRCTADEDDLRGDRAERLGGGLELTVAHARAIGTPRSRSRSASAAAARTRTSPARNASVIASSSASCGSDAAALPAAR